MVPITVIATVLWYKKVRHFHLQAVARMTSGSPRTRASTITSIQTRKLCLVLLVGLSTACGGGGGSSPSGGGSQPGPQRIVEPAAPVVNYDGNRQPVELSKDNAAELAYRAYRLRAVTQLLENFWIESGPGPLDETTTEAGLFGGTARVRGELDSNGFGYVQVTYEDFANDSSDSSVTVNGRYIQRYRPETGVAPETDFSFAGPGLLEFDNLTVANSTDSISLHGVLRVSGINSNSFNVNLIYSDDSSNEQLFFEDCSVSFTEKFINGAPYPAVEIAGSVYSHSDGRLDVSSLGSTPYLGFIESAGYITGGAGGGIELTSAGPTAHVRPLSYAFVSVILDLDGDSVPETARRFTWPELSGELSTESSVLAGPIANAGEKRSPRASEPVNVHGLFSHDDDGDWLTFEWSVIAKPALSSLSVDSRRSNPVLELSLDVPGDYVMGLRASDGGLSSKTALVLRHAPSDSVTEVDNVTRAGLEVGQPIAPFEPILIDARSALIWPYDDPPLDWSRGGFGPSGFQPTGDPASTYFTVESEGLNAIRFSAPSSFGGARNSSAAVDLAVGPSVFETPIEIASDANAFDIHKVDFDNDLDDDLVLRIGDSGNERILVLLATPEGLTPGVDIPAGSGELAVGDVNGDGRQDVLSSADNELLVFLQAPDNSLAEPLLFEFPATGCISAIRLSEIALADIDGGGQIDIVATHPCKDALVIWPGNSDGTFAAPLVKLYDNHRIEGMAVGDINSDGRADTALVLNAISTLYREGVSILHGQANGELIENEFIETGVLFPPGLSIGDIDGDLRNDLVILTLNSINLRLQAADGTLGNTTLDFDPENPGFRAPVSIVDLDGDGTKDLFFCDDGPVMRLLRQADDGTFSLVEGSRCSNNGIGRSEIAVSLDVNSDGHIDLVTLTDNNRGAIDDRALLTVFLENVHSYPLPVAQ